jgi:hypothetical protein
MKRLAVVTLLVVMTVSAHAEGRKRSTAQALSGVGVGVSSGLFLSAFLVLQDNHEVNRPLLYSGLFSAAITPSLGELYAGEWLTIGMGVRTAAAALAAYGVTQTDEVRCIAPGVQTCQELNGKAIVFLGLAAIAFVGGAAYDVMDADEAVDRYNAKHSVVVAPSVFPSGGGVELIGTF